MQNMNNGKLYILSDRGLMLEEVGQESICLNDSSPLVEKLENVQIHLRTSTMYVYLSSLTFQNTV